MTATIKPVPFDPEIADHPMLQGSSDSGPMTNEQIAAGREGFANSQPSLDEVIAGRPVEHEDRTIPGPAGAPDLRVTILRPAGGVTGAGGMYCIHGGGMIMGTRFNDAATLIDRVLKFGIVIVSVEYRLAPEHPDPAPVEDCYAGLLWTFEHAEELGIDPNRLFLRGASAGGGLCAAMALMARDRNGPKLAGQMLICPMIDDRDVTVSTMQYDGLGVWTRAANHTGWNALLGDRRFGSDVSPYAAPSRAQDVSNLPPAFIEVGSAEVFRDEDVDYASRIWAVGGQAELHVWSGCFHGFAQFAPDAKVSRAATAARESWIARIIGS